MTALAAKFEAFDSPASRALAFLFALTSTLLLTLNLNLDLNLAGNLLLRYP